MILKRIAFGLAAGALVAAPVAAETAIGRSAAPISDEAELGSAGITPALIVLAIAGIGMAALLLTDDDDDDEDFPVSP